MTSSYLRSLPRDVVVGARFVNRPDVRLEVDVIEQLTFACKVVTNLLHSIRARHVLSLLLSACKSVQMCSIARSNS